MISRVLKTTKRRCRHIRSTIGGTFSYTEYDENTVSNILTQIEPSIDKAISCTDSIEKIIKEYVLQGGTFINGIKTLPYLGIEKGNLTVTSVEV